MRKRSLLAIALALTACYSSPVPVAEPDPNTPVDTALLGYWRQIDADGGSTAEFLVLHFAGPEYYVEFNDDKEVGRMRAYATIIDGVGFANLQTLQSARREYGIYRYSLDGSGTLTLQGLRERTPKFNRSADLHAYLKAHHTDSTIYDDAARFRKVKPAIRE